MILKQKIYVALWNVEYVSIHPNRRSVNLQPDDGIIFIIKLYWPEQKCLSPYYLWVVIIEWWTICLHLVLFRAKPIILSSQLTPLDRTSSLTESINLLHGLSRPLRPSNSAFKIFFGTAWRHIILIWKR